MVEKEQETNHRRGWYWDLHSFGETFFESALNWTLPKIILVSLFYFIPQIMKKKKKGRKYEMHNSNTIKCNTMGLSTI